MTLAQELPPARTLLVVEDAESCAAALEVALLGIAGLTLRFVQSAEEALRMLSLEDFAALITDVQLPHMDGLELLARVRSDPRHARLPVLVISGDPDPRTPIRALSLGAGAFFSKPYSPAAVRRKVEELINAK